MLIWTLIIYCQLWTLNNNLKNNKLTSYQEKVFSNISNKMMVFKLWSKSLRNQYKAGKTKQECKNGYNMSLNYKISLNSHISLLFT